MPKRVAASSKASNPLSEESDDAIVTLPHCCSSSDSSSNTSISLIQSYVSCTNSISAGFVRALVSRQAARADA